MNINDKLKALEEKIDIIIEKYNELLNDNEELISKIALLEEENEKLNREKQVVIEKVEQIISKLP